jgi:hypothetical protein
VGDGRCCYIMVEFATAATQNGVCIIQPMSRVMILVYDRSLIKKMYVIKISYVFCHFMNNIDLLMMEKLKSTTFCDASVAKFNFM